MSALRPSAVMPRDESGLPRTTLLVMAGGRDAQDIGSIADRLSDETGALLDSLEGTIARLALAHRACVTDSADQSIDQSIDDEAFAWIQDSIEDISATLRGLHLGRESSELQIRGPLVVATGSD